MCDRHFPGKEHQLPRRGALFVPQMGSADGLAGSVFSALEFLSSLEASGLQAMADAGLLAVASLEDVRGCVAQVGCACARLAAPWASPPGQLLTPPPLQRNC